MSKIKRDKVIVLDCEMTCWADKEEQGDQKSEIIQIGLCLFNAFTGEITKEKSYYIQPVSKKLILSQYCKDLTGIESLKGAIPLVNVCNSIAKNYGSQNRIVAAFGNDTTKFREDCKLKGAMYPFSESIIDVSLWFHLHNHLKGNIGLAECLWLSGLTFEGKQHNALADAKNTARLFKQLIN